MDRELILRKANDDALKLLTGLQGVVGETLQNLLECARAEREQSLEGKIVGQSPGEVKGTRLVVEGLKKAVQGVALKYGPLFDFIALTAILREALENSEDPIQAVRGAIEEDGALRLKRALKSAEVISDMFELAERSMTELGRG